MIGRVFITAVIFLFYTTNKSANSQRSSKNPKLPKNTLAVASPKTSCVHPHATHLLGAHGDEGGEGAGAAAQAVQPAVLLAS